MDKISAVTAIVGSAFGIMLTIVSVAVYLTNRFGKVETRLAVVESVLRIKNKETDS
jgi:hypothetical protein